MSIQSQKHFSELVAKFLDGSITKEDRGELLDFFLNNQEIKDWPSHLGSKEEVEERIYEKIRLELDFGNNEEVKIVPIYRKSFFKYAVAASITLLITFMFVFQNRNHEVLTKAAANKIQIGSDKAILTLEDGTNVSLGEGRTYKNKNLNSTGEELSYLNSGSASKKVAYNYLTIPRGGQFSIVLSDGTKVWLNSETKLKFPVNFAEGKTRSVELVYGEAYFDVSPSTAHNGAGFTVIQKSQEVHVLGTQFNIKAYNDDPYVSTTLVEGKVEMQFDSIKQDLLPNQRAFLDIKTNKVKIANVEVNNEISWKNGVFSFEDKPLDEIMKVLSRWYDIEVIFENESIRKEKFNGVLVKDRNIDEILMSIKNYGIINKYEFKDKTLILK
jgi:ferric-dicitrate binding protein FerR (iron transport regulator)